EDFRDKHNWNSCAACLPLGSCSLKLFYGLLRCAWLLGPQPIGQSKKNHAPENKRQISQRQSQKTKNQNVPCGNKDRRNENDKKGAIHCSLANYRERSPRATGLILAKQRTTPPVDTAPGSYPSPTKPRP